MTADTYQMIWSTITAIICMANDKQPDVTKLGGVAGIGVGSIRRRIVKKIIRQLLHDVTAMPSIKK